MAHIQQLKCLHSQKGIIFNLAKLENAKPGVVKKLKTKLTFTKKQQAGRRVFYKKAYFYKIYDRSTKLFVIAEAAFYQDYKNIRSKILPPNITIIRKIPNGQLVDPSHYLNADNNGPGIKLYPNQQVVHDYLMKNYFNDTAANSGNSGCILVMETGLGKSFLAAAAIATSRLKTLLVLMNTSQVQQWSDDVFKKYYPHLKVGYYYGKKKQDGDVVLAVINSLSKIPASYLKEFGFIIWDEIPEYMGETRRQVLWNTSMKYQLGLTATPDERLDGFDIVYKQHIGPLVFANKIDGFDVEDIEWKGTVTAIRYNGPPKYTQILTSRTGEMNTSMMNSQFSNDPYRTKLIIYHAQRLYNKGKQVYIFAQKREHLEFLEKKLLEVGIEFCDGNTLDNVQTLMGGATDEDVVKAKQKSKIILTTYKYGSVGLSIVRMDGIIFATPRKNKMRQILGRILRRGSDPSIEREIIDIIDNATRMKHQFNSRKVVYIEKGFTINEDTVNYTELNIDD